MSTRRRGSLNMHRSRTFLKKKKTPSPFLRPISGGRIVHLEYPIPGASANDPVVVVDSPDPRAAQQAQKTRPRPRPPVYGVDDDSDNCGDPLLSDGGSPIKKTRRGPARPRQYTAPRHTAAAAKKSTSSARFIAPAASATAAPPPATRCRAWSSRRRGRPRANGTDGRSSSHVPRLRICRGRRYRSCKPSTPTRPSTTT